MRCLVLLLIFCVAISAHTIATKRAPGFVLLVIEMRSDAHSEQPQSDSRY